MSEERFSYRYSAPTAEERMEIEGIRRRYLPQEERERKLARIKELDARVRRRSVGIAVAIGVTGTLIFGLGLCMVLEWSLFAWGSVVALSGAAVAALAHVVRRVVYRRDKARAADEILRLSDELLGEERQSLPGETRGVSETRGKE